ncbi:MAG TPA: DUF4157 domain-containing protein, partial [Polyangia bacterium]|nr:DUF4157 domain-containing protein [Polyangia bacterium]
NVRLHDGGVAAAAARALGAVAYTAGSDVVLGAGAPPIDSLPGRQLLAHELAHVKQSPTAPGARADAGSWRVRVSSPSDRAEREADRIAGQLLWPGGSPPPRSLLSAATVQPEAGTLEVRRQVFGPAQKTQAGSDFDEFILQANALEGAAQAEGFSQTDTITAFRKIFYPSGAPAKTYMGATVGGGAFGLIIPGAAGTPLPHAWSTPGLDGAVQYLRAHQVLTIAGKQVDIGHFLTGADAAQHPTPLSLGGGMLKFRSNQELATFVGDLGSVVTEYFHGSTTSFRDTAMVRSSALDTFYDRFASPSDMAGNADAYAMTIDPAKSFTQNLLDYYAGAGAASAQKRFTRFAAAIGLGAPAGRTFAGDTPAWRSAMQNEVFNAALAYAAANNHKDDVGLVFKDPGPGIFVPTYWEAFTNISGWVVDIFLSRLAAQVAGE